MATTTPVSNAQPRRASRWSQYMALTKPRVVQLIVFCAVIGMLLAVPGVPEWRVTAAATVGIWLVASAAAAFNCLVERQVDRKMARTAWRPTARGDLSDGQALSFSMLLGAAGSLLLYLAVNPLTMGLTLATFVGYAIVYTVILKPMTPQNIVIGGASGAMPPVLGWAAMRNDVGPEAMLLCLIIFLWTPPHFWALALYRTEDTAVPPANAAGDPRLAVHAPARVAVHAGAVCGHVAAVRLRHEWLAVPAAAALLGFGLHRLCLAPVASLQ
jgi:protoheme IX farnesyltransferase